MLKKKSSLGYVSMEYVGHVDSNVQRREEPEAESE